MRSLKLRLAAGTAGALVVLGAGAAIAATKPTPKQESAAVVADAAKQLGVTSAELTAALKQALQNRVDAALAAGEVTQAQAAEMKARIAAGEVPLVGLGHDRGRHGGPGHHGLVAIDAAASFLGVTEAQLRTRLEAGQTLAEVAKAEGKARAGLVDALAAAAEERLDEKVADGELTAAQRTRMLADLRARIEATVDGQSPLGRGHGPRPAGHDA